MVSKHYDPPRDWTVSVADYVWVPYMYPVTTCSGKPITCRTSYQSGMRQQYVGSHLENRHADEEFWIEVVDGDGDHGWARVGRVTWQEAQVGSHVKEEK